MDAIRYGVASNVMSNEEFDNFLNNLGIMDAQVVLSDISRALHDNIYESEEERRTWVGRQRKVDELFTQLQLAALDEEEMEEDLEDTVEIPEEIFHSSR